MTLRTPWDQASKGQMNINGVLKFPKKRGGRHFKEKEMRTGYTTQKKHNITILKQQREKKRNTD